MPLEGFPTNVTIQLLLDLPIIPEPQPLPIYVETASATDPEPQVMPDPLPVLQPRPGGGIENVKERIFAFLNQHLKVGPKYTATHDGENKLHSVSLTIPGISCLINLC